MKWPYTRTSKEVRVGLDTKLQWSFVYRAKEIVEKKYQRKRDKSSIQISQNKNAHCWTVFISKKS